MGYVEADAGTITSETKLNLAETSHAKQQLGTSSIVFDSANNEFDLAAETQYELTVYIPQTGAGAYIQVYNVTGTAAMFTTVASATAKSFTFEFKTSTAISIAIRADDQSANSTGATATQVRLVRIGELLTV